MRPFHLFLTSLCLFTSLRGAEGPPNFIVILGEGHGWSSTSVQMDDRVPESKSSTVRTPNLEKLAQAGMRFSNYYAPSPRCTPTRASLFTGKSPAQLHMTFVGEGKKDEGSNQNGKVNAPVALMELPLAETTIAELLKSAGYATAHFGKWHVGRTSPSQHGFDESDGPTSNGGPGNVDNPHPKELIGMTDRGIDFLSRQAKAGKPFYLQLSHYASRDGTDATPESIEKVKSWNLNLQDRDLGNAATFLDLDDAFGRLMAKLDELGLVRNTYVIFTTDHGTPGKNSPLAGGKGTVSEGGLRVPFIVRGPGIQPGTFSHVRVFGEDLLPTVADLAKIHTPMAKDIEGGSLTDLLSHAGKGIVKRSHEDFVVHFPHYDKDAAGPASTILSGDFKLIRVYETGELHLYHLAIDPGERRDLAKDQPDKATELDKRLSDYLASVNAQMPTPNTAYDPSKPTEFKQGGKRGGKGQGKGKEK